MNYVYFNFKNNFQKTYFEINKWSNKINTIQYNRIYNILVTIIYHKENERSNANRTTRHIFFFSFCRNMFLCSFISIILYTLVVCQPNTLTQPPTSIPPSTYFLQANTTNSNSTTTNNSTTTMSPTPQTSNHTTTIPHSVLCGPCDKGSHRPANKLTRNNSVFFSKKKIVVFLLLF